MKKFALLLVITFATAVNFHACAQVTTKYNDNVSTMDGIIKAYYDVVTVEKGGRISFERDSLLHWPGAMVCTVGMGKDGKPRLNYISLKEYHRRADKGLEQNGFYEREIARKTEKFGAIYHVWSTYASRNEATGPIIERGINSIDLFNDGTRFWILGWSYDNERTNNPIPKEYLSN